MQQQVQLPTKIDKNSPTIFAVACELGNGIAAVGFGSWLFTVALMGPQDTLLGFKLFMDDALNYRFQNNIG